MKKILPQVKHTVAKYPGGCSLAARGYVRIPVMEEMPDLHNRLLGYRIASIRESDYIGLTEYFTLQYLDNKEQKRMRVTSAVERVFVTSGHLALYRIRMFVRKVIRVSIRFSERRQSVQ